MRVRIKQPDPTNDFSNLWYGDRIGEIFEVVDEKTMNFTNDYSEGMNFFSVIDGNSPFRNTKRIVNKVHTEPVNEAEQELLEQNPTQKCRHGIFTLTCPQCYKELCDG